MTDSTTTKPDNPAVFPSRRDVPDGLASRRDDVPGMTLRDWFAGQALAGLMGNSKLNARNEMVSSVAYALADVMLAEREKSDD